MKINKYLLAFILSISLILGNSSLLLAKTNTSPYAKYKLGVIPAKSTDNGTISLNDYLNKNNNAIQTPNLSLKEYSIPNLIPALDQGMYGSCVSYALREEKDIMALNDSNPDNDHQHSTGFIYGYRVGGYTGEGMETIDALTGLRKNGTCLDSTFPDQGEYPDLHAKITQSMIDEAKHHRIDDYIRLHNTTEIKTALMNISPVYISFKVYDSFYFCFKDGILPTPNKSQEEYCGDHGVVITGWKYNNNNNKLYWRVLNSWSSDFGDNGYCWMPSDYPINEYWALVDSDESKTEDIQPTPISKIKNLDVSVDHSKVFIDDNLQLTAIVDKKYNLTEEVNWSTSNTSIATIDNNGILTGIKKGRVRVYANYCGRKDYIYVTIVNRDRYYSVEMLKTKNKTDAEGAVIQLNDYGFDYEVFMVQVGKYYKVDIGKFADKRDSAITDLIDEIRSSFIVTPKVVYN